MGLDLSPDYDKIRHMEFEKKVTVIGFGRRLAAFLLDSLIVTFIGILIAVPIVMIAFVLQAIIQDRPVPIERWVIGAGALVSILYFIAFWARSGQTVGMGVIGIKVVTADGKPLTIGKAFLRYIGYFVSAVVFAIGFLWINFDRMRQGWHDKFAGTYVVNVFDEFTNIKEEDVEVSDPKNRWIWIVLWLFLAISMPLALATTLLTIGPYVSSLLHHFVQGLR